MQPVKLVTVITPVYNAGPYINVCIDSILAQSYSNFELLLINDGSTDNSGMICNDYAKKDSRVKVFHQENKGVSEARNFALKRAKGEWVAFVDSDDRVLTNYIKDLIEATDYETDLVVQGFQKVYKSVTKKFDLGNHIIHGKCNTEKLFEKLKIFDFGFVVSKLYKKSIIDSHHLLFPVKTAHAEDLIFLLEYIAVANKIVFQKKHNYEYFYRDNSLSVTFQKPEVYFYQYNLLKETLKYNFRSVYDDLHSTLNNEFMHTRGIQFSTLLKFLKSMYHHKISRTERLCFYNAFHDDDLTFLYANSNSIKNPILKAAYHLIGKSNYKLGDTVLFFYYRMVKKSGFFRKIMWKSKKPYITSISKN